LQGSEPNWQDVVDLHEQAQRNLKLAIAMLDEATAALHEVQNRLAQAKISCEEVKSGKGL
jgi:flagellar hook-basal body complex protein FliE